MKIQCFFLYWLFFCTSVFAVTAEEYNQKFQTYIEWSQQLPLDLNPQFLSFITLQSPLTNKLRAKWLYDLAAKKNWVTFTRYYQPSEDVSLQCYATLARYHQLDIEGALQSVKPLWLNGQSQPTACNELFSALLKHKSFDETLLTQRIELALEQRNLSLAKYLLKQYKQPRLQEAQTLTTIYLSPQNIVQLQPGQLHDAFYLYGLKRIVSIDINQAIALWNHPKTSQFLKEKQQQAFLIHLTLYKSMRDHDDTLDWFSKIKPTFYNDVLMDWQIRYALKRKQWAYVEKMISLSNDKQNPSYQYWLARAIEAQGNAKAAKDIYEKIAISRNYYGFLASLRLNKPLKFEDEPSSTDLTILSPYQTVLEQIKLLLNTNQLLQASRLINDFVLELPKAEKSALAFWLAKEMQWYFKSIHLSNSDDLTNQLSLRFPVAYQPVILKNAKQHDISEILIYAIIRQESMFKEDVISFAGAHGLMQVMPKTAQLIAKKNAIPFTDNKQLFYPAENIAIGVAYLKQLSARFNNHPLLMAAAYNAGPTRVSYWLNNHAPKDIDIWVETLPWHETRNYIKNVIAFYAVYQYRLGIKPNLKSFMRSFY